VASECRRLFFALLHSVARNALRLRKEMQAAER
jgi:hypothetical protein